jgi:hypothetical protein
MPQFKLIFQDLDGVNHEYIRHGINKEEALDFTPMSVVNDDFDNIIPLDAEFISIEEMKIWVVFHLDESNWFNVKSLAESRGLTAKKDTGSYCLKVSGFGDWVLLEDWIKGFKVLNSNWLGWPPV